MDKQELAEYIHDRNTSCKKMPKGKDICMDCLCLAGHILIHVGVDFTKQGARSIHDVHQD